jgi:iron complex outermembrane recepter protein
MVPSYTSITHRGRALLLGTALATIAAVGSPVFADETETIIVTGTRTTGMTEANSPAPIQIVTSEALSHVGSASLFDALQQQVPSIQIQNTGTGGDLADFVQNIRMDGLGPNETLVLVNGKRLHPTGVLQIDGGAFQGSFAPDVSWIPLASIDHVEVLEEGAGAQYGTDAVAGVVNIILKSDASAGVASGTIGANFEGGGETYDLTVNKGFALGDHGFLNLTYDKKYHGFAQESGPDERINYPDVSGQGFTPGGIIPGLGFDPTTIPGYPRENRIDWQPWSEASIYALNAGYDVTSNVHLYAFGSYGNRDSDGYENVRLPNLIVGQCAPPAVAPPCTQELGVQGTIGTPGAIVEAPNGFDPLESIIETSYTATFGIKGEFDGFNWDVSSTYGKDTDHIYTDHSRNASLFINTGFTPTDFYDGAFIATEFTNNLDITRDFDVGLAGPLTVAFGGDERENTYQIQQGDAASTYAEGGQSYPGYAATDAGTHDRKNYAGYIDFAVLPIEALQIDVAGRFEHYTDFGDAPIGKVTARYDITPEFAIRGTASTGFRAPTQGEEYYSATSVSPTTAFVNLPADSPAAGLLGLPPLKPEHSTNYSVGFTAQPIDNLSMTLDAYSISLRDAIESSGTLVGTIGNCSVGAPCATPPTIVSQAVYNAIIAHSVGTTIDPSVLCCGFTGVTVFTNGVDLDTKGLNFSAHYNSDFDEYGTVMWTVSANYSVTAITREQLSTPQLAGQPLFSANSNSLLTDATPKAKVILAGNWSLDRWRLRLQETIYGATSVQNNPAFAPPWIKDEVPLAGITDIEIGYKVTDHLTLTTGANNVFNKLPPRIPLYPGAGTAGSSPVPYPASNDGGLTYGEPNGVAAYGTGGGTYYVRATVTF